MVIFTTAARVNKTAKTRRGFSFPACSSTYRYQAPYKIGEDFRHKARSQSRRALEGRKVLATQNCGKKTAKMFQALIGGAI